MPLINLEQFIREERPFWDELEQALARMDKGKSAGRLTLEEVQRFHYLYQRAGSGLARVATFAGEGELRAYLEHLVARAYGVIHETRSGGARFHPLRWLFGTFPRTIRRHAGALILATFTMILGAVFGAFVLASDYEGKWQLIPSGFGHLHSDPARRVAWEEKEGGEWKSEPQLESIFSSYLMVNNTRVSITTMSAGAVWGVGALVILFYNGILVGAVAYDYVQADQTEFLLGWLLPHGSIELPAIMLAGQAGLVLGGAIIGWGRRISLRARLRQVAPDLVTLIGGVALMLVWAGLIEAFLSQKHEPVIPYELKIAFGTVELVLLVLFIVLCGRGAQPAGEERA